MKQLIVFLLLSSAAQAAAYVQGVNNRVTASTMVQVTFDDSTASGNLIVCGIASSNTTDTMAVTDSQMNMYALVGSLSDGTNEVQIVYAANIHGDYMAGKAWSNIEKTTITLNAQATATHTMACQEWFEASGVGTPATATGTASTPATATFNAAPFDGIFAFAAGSAAVTIAGAQTSLTEAYIYTCGNVTTTGTVSPYIQQTCQQRGITMTNAAAAYSIAPQSGIGNTAFSGSGSWIGIAADIHSNSAVHKNPHLLVFNIAYGIANHGYQQRPSVASWFTRRFDILNGNTVNPAPYSCCNIMTPSVLYNDSSAAYLNEFYALFFDPAVQFGWNPENAVLHSATNYVISSPGARLAYWADMGLFNAFESTSTTGGPGSVAMADAATNGAFLYNGTTYADITGPLFRAGCSGATYLAATSAVCGQSSPYAFLGVTVPNNGYLYLSYTEPFDTINVGITTPRAGGTGVWEYWNGATWTPFTANFTDSTSGASSNSSVSITQVNAIGSGYSYANPPAVTFMGGGGSGATGTVMVDTGGRVIYVNVTSGGTGYTSAPAVSFESGTAAAVAFIGGQVKFHPPSDWKTRTTNSITGGTTANGNRTKYWVRLAISGATTPPTLSAVKGDSILITDGSGGQTGGVNNDGRGWCVTCTHINVGLGNHGELEYDPNPPMNALARFLYQGRTTGGWAYNAVPFNPFDCQPPATWGFMGYRGNCTPTQIFAMQSRWAPLGTVPNTTGALYAGIMVDNSFYYPSGIATGMVNIIEAPQCAAVSGPGGTPAAHCATSGMSFNNLDNHKAMAAMLLQIPTIIDHRFNPPAMFLNALRGTEPYFNQIADFGLDEIIGGYGGSFAPDLNLIKGRTANYLTAVNPRDTKLVAELWDYLPFGRSSGSPSQFIPYTPNRTAMNALGIYYLTGNPNVVLYYYNSSGFSYYDLNEFYFWSPASTTLTQAMTAGTTGNGQVIHVADASGFNGIASYEGRYSGLIIQVGGVDNFQVTKGSDTTLTTSNASGIAYNTVTQSWPAGTTVKYARVGHWARQKAPPPEDIFTYTAYFPAMDVDVGVPDPNGFMGGALGSIPIYVGGVMVTDANINGWRRDFTNAIVIMRQSANGNGLNIMSDPIDAGGTFYLLNADGTTGPAVTSVSLRAGETAVLMKQPAGPPPPPIISGVPGFSYPIP